MISLINFQFTFRAILRRKEKRKRFFALIKRQIDQLLPLFLTFNRSKQKKLLNSNSNYGLTMNSEWYLHL